MKFDFEKETGKLFLRVEDITPPTFIIPHINLIQKKEFHITLIAYKLAESICASTGKTHEEIASIIEPVLERTMPTFEHTGEYYLLYKKYSITDERSSIIELVSSTSIEKMFDKLSAALGTVIETPFLHLTLYTTGTNEATRNQGIGVTSDKIFKDVCVARVYPEA